MTGKVMLSSAYMPPVEYFGRIGNSAEVFIEREENYIKQSYRNRCYILSSNGPQILTVPVCTGNHPKTPIKDIRIDYSKRWQQVHAGALRSSYNSSPYFMYYYDQLEGIIQSNYIFLLDLNMDLLIAILGILKLETKIRYTTCFKAVTKDKDDLRYTISPKERSDYTHKEYPQVFGKQGRGFIPRLSILDLIFNMGPDSLKYI